MYQKSLYSQILLYQLCQTNYFTMANYYKVENVLPFLSHL